MLPNLTKIVCTYDIGKHSSTKIQLKHKHNKTGIWISRSCIRISERPIVAAVGGLLRAGAGQMLVSGIFAIHKTKWK